MVKMRKFMLACAALPLLCVGPAFANVLGPDAGVCTAGDGPAILVKVVGLKNRVGKVRARTFTGNPKTYFDRKFYLKRTEVDVPDSGAVELCMPVPKPGRYAIDIRHDINNNGDTDKADGAGTSGNPSFSLFDILFKRRPPANKVEISVGDGVVSVPIVVNYLQGGSLKPATNAVR